MSDLLIRGMEKPEDWRDCMFGNGAAQCNLRPALGYCNREICPLVSIPEHGRLIDADNLRKLFAENYMWAAGTYTDHQPTIIEANK